MLLLCVMIVGLAIFHFVAAVQATNPVGLSQSLQGQMKTATSVELMWLHREMDKS